MNGSHFDPLDQSLIDRLDALGETERDGAPAGLEERVLARALDEARTTARDDGPAVIGRIGVHRAPLLRIAAAIVLAAGVLLVARSVLTPRGAGLVADPAPTTDELIAEIDTEFEAWLATVEPSMASELGPDLASIGADLANAEMSLEELWFSEDPLDVLLEDSL